jgi:hypothetical protein
MNIFEKMTAAERAKAGDTILAASEHMSVEEKRTLIVSLTDSLAGIQAKGGGDDKQRTVLSKISAARSLSSRSAIDMQYIDGSLRRAGAPPIEELAVKPEHEIQAVLASAGKKFSEFERIAVRNMLSRIGAMRR